MSLSGDLSSTSFASGRIGILSERTVFQQHQQRYIKAVLTPIYRRWLKSSMLTGELKLPTMRPADYFNVIWHPRPFPWIDPQKDIELATRSVAMGTDTLTRLAAEQGRSFEDVMRERRAELDLAEQYDVPLIIEAGRAKPIDADVTQEAEQDTGDQKGTNPPGTPQEKPTPAPTNQRKPVPSPNGNGTNGHRSHIPTLR
jgi:capsid protein